MSSWSNLGLSGLQDDVFCYLVRRPGSADIDACTNLGITIEQFHQVRNELRDRRLLEESVHGDLRPVNPVQAAQVLLAEELKSINSRFTDLARLAGSVPALVEELGLSPEYSSGVEHVQSLPQLRDRVEDISFLSRSEVAAVWTNKSMSEETLARARPQDLRLLRRGVRVRTIISAQTATDPIALSYFQELSEHGSEVRVAPVAQDRLMLWDRAIAIIPKDPQDHSLGALIVHEPGLVKTLCRFYDLLWENATPLQRVPQQTSLLLSDTDIQVLQTLCRVAKDEAGAKELGVSVRTYRRYVADVVQVLGANNRVDAALQARALGFI